MHFEMSSAICFNLDLSKILLSGNGLTVYIYMKLNFFLCVITASKLANSVNKVQGLKSGGYRFKFSAQPSPFQLLTGAIVTGIIIILQRNFS